MGVNEVAAQFRATDVTARRLLPIRHVLADLSPEFQRQLRFLTGDLCFC